MNAPERFNLNLTRFIRAPIHKVFDAFATQAGLASWMGSRGMHARNSTANPCVGGAWRVELVARDGHDQGWQSTLNRLNDYLDPMGAAGTFTLMGDVRSTYTRTVRMAFAEKGVAYTLKTTAPRTPVILAMHPGRPVDERRQQLPVRHHGETLCVATPVSPR